MRNIFCLFTYPESLEPFSKYIPEIVIAGKSLFEQSIFVSKEFKGKEIIVIDKNMTISKNSKELGIEDKNLHIINSLTAMDQYLSSDIIFFTGETVFSLRSIDFINKNIQNDPKTLQIFGTDENTSKFQINTVYIEKDEDQSTKIKILGNLHLARNLQQVIAIFIPKSIVKLLVSFLIENLLSKKQEAYELMLNEYKYFKLEHDSFVKIQFPWEIIKANEILLSEISLSLSEDIDEGVQINGNVFIEPGAKILHGTYINGPVYISQGSVIGPNCFLRGTTFIGRNVHIGQSVEIKNSVILNNTNIGHLSYIGDSIIGPNNNFGAGSKTANLAFHDQSIKMNVLNERMDSKRRKLGIITGKNVKTGINSSIMPGVKLYDNSIVGANVLLQDDLPEQTIVAFNKKNELMKEKHHFY